MALKVGKTYGGLTVKSLRWGKYKRFLAVCKCICGKEICTAAWKVHRGITTSCGCLRKIVLDGIRFGSILEASVYLDLKGEKGILHDVKYGEALGKMRYDFYLPEQNKWIEVTSYNSRSRGWKDYSARIARKKKWVETQGGTFLFIKRKPTVKDISKVWKAIHDRK